MAPLVLALVFCGLFIHHVSYHVRPSVPLLKCLTLSRYIGRFKKEAFCSRTNIAEPGSIYFQINPGQRPSIAMLCQEIGQSSLEG